MSDKRYDVILLGEVQPRARREEVVNKLARRFKRDPQQIATLLARGRTVIKRNIDLKTAHRYRDAVQIDGGRCQVMEVALPPDPIDFGESLKLEAPILPHVAASGEHTAVRPAFGPEPTRNLIPRPRLVAAALIVVLGVGAAVAAWFYPQYQETRMLDDFALASRTVDNAQNQIADRILRDNEYPADNAAAGIPLAAQKNVASLNVSDDGIIEVRYGRIGSESGWTSTWKPVRQGAQVHWACLDSTVPAHVAKCDKQRAEALLRASSRTIRDSGRTVSLRVPVNWQELDGEDEVVLWAEDERDERYVLVSRELRGAEPDLSVYTARVRADLTDNMENAYWLQADLPLQLGTTPARRMMIAGEVDGIAGTYVVTVFADSRYYYRLLAWTLSERFDAARQQLTEVSDSLRLP